MAEALLGQAAWFVGGLLLVVALIWAVARSQSLFEVRYRLWRLVRSGHEISDEAVRAAVQSRADLVSFRTLLIWADTPGEMKRILDYARQHELEPGLLRDCGRYFHRRDLAIKPSIPSLGKAKALYLLQRFGLLLVAVFAAICLIETRVLVSFNDDGTKAWIGVQEAQRFWDGKLVLVPDNCPKTNVGVAGFNAAHTQAFCQAFGSKAMKVTFNQGLMQQRVLGASLTALALIVYVFWRRRFHQARAAHAVRGWLAFRQASAEQAGASGSSEEQGAGVDA